MCRFPAVAICLPVTKNVLTCQNQRQEQCNAAECDHPAREPRDFQLPPHPEAGENPKGHGHDYGVYRNSPAIVGHKQAVPAATVHSLEEWLRYKSLPLYQQAAFSNGIRDTPRRDGLVAHDRQRTLVLAERGPEVPPVAGSEEPAGP